MQTYFFTQLSKEFKKPNIFCIDNAVLMVLWPMLSIVWTSQMCDIHESFWSFEIIIGEMIPCPPFSLCTVGHKMSGPSKLTKLSYSSEENQELPPHSPYPMFSFPLNLSNSYNKSINPKNPFIDTGWGDVRKSIPWQKSQIYYIVFCCCLLVSLVCLHSLTFISF